MTKSLKFSILIFLSVFVVHSASGQRLLKNITDKVKQKVEQRVEERVEQKVDEKIDNELDKIEDSLEKNQEEQGDSSGEVKDDASRDARMQKRMQGLMKGLGMSGEPVPFADNYGFDHLIQMHITSENKAGEKTSEGEFITHLNPESKSMAYQVVSGDMAKPGQGMFIIDTENKAIIILSEENGQKLGLVYGIGSFFQSVGETYEENEPEETPEMYLANPNVEKTGRSKTIAGYKCDEYVYNDEESVSHIWITRDLKLNNRDYFSTLYKSSLYSRGFPWGYMMEAETTDKETGEKSTMTVTRVDDNSNVSFSMGDYQLTNLGSLTLPAEEE